MEERRHLPPLSNEDIDKIANAITEKAHRSFHIAEEQHYNSHKRLDKLLDSYDSATNLFLKAFWGLVIIGLIFFAGFGFWKGH